MENSTFALVPFLQDNALVIIALVLCGLLAALVLLGMAWGAKLKRERTHAEHEEAARIDQLEAEGHVAAPTEAQQAAGVTAPGDTSTSSHAEALPRTDPPADEASAPGPVPASPHPGSPPRAEPPADEAPARDPLADEPIAAAAPLDASPASEAESSPAAPAAGGEPVTRLKGLGPKVAARLAELGVSTVDQLAALDDAQAARLDEELGAFQGRMARDQWREQARLLARGDRAGYEATYGKLG